MAHGDKTMDRPVVILRVMDGSWYADYGQTPEAEAMAEAIGVTTVRTPFLAAKPAAEVQSRIAKLNPMYDVVVA